MNGMAKKGNAKILEALGAKNTGILFKKLGLTKTLIFWKNLNPEMIIEIIELIGIEESAYLTRHIPLKDVKKWIRKKGLRGLPVLAEHLGVENLVKVYNILGIDRCIKLTDMIAPEEMIVLSRELKKSSFPRLNSRSSQEIEKWKEVIKKGKGKAGFQAGRSGKSGSSRKKTGKKATKIITKRPVNKNRKPEIKKKSMKTGRSAVKKKTVRASRGRKGRNPFKDKWESFIKGTGEMIKKSKKRNTAKGKAVKKAVKKKGQKKKVMKKR